MSPTGKELEAARLLLVAAVAQWHRTGRLTPMLVEDIEIFIRRLEPRELSRFLAEMRQAGPCVVCGLTGQHGDTCPAGVPF